MALDQFMSQRALKRTLMNKAEKARRAARGMPVDATLEGDYGDGDVDLGDGGVTVVCAQDTVEEVLRGSGGGGGDGREEDDDEVRHDEEQKIIDDSSSTMMPRPDEDFRDFMLRMDEEKENNNVSPSYHRQHMEESFHDREAFDNFSGGGSVVVSSSSSSREYPLVQNDQFAQEEEASLLEEEDVRSSKSTGSSITTRSAHRWGTEKDIIMTTTSSPFRNNNNEGGGRSVVGRGVPAAGRMETMDTLQSLNEDDSVESQESTIHINGGATTTIDVEQSLLTKDASSTNEPPLPRSAAAPARPTLPGAVNRDRDSLDISEGDYVDEKAGERSMRRLLANTIHGERGVFQIDAAAPARQNCGSGGGRTARVNRTASQRRARMAELEASEAGGGGGGSGAKPSGMGGGGGEGNDAMTDADIERADSYTDEMFGQMDSRRSSRFSLIGLDGEDDGLDRKVFGIIGVLLVGLLVMVVVLMMR